MSRDEVMAIDRPRQLVRQCAPGAVVWGIFRLHAIKHTPMQHIGCPL